MTWLMPDTAEARFYGYTENWEEWRRWWAVNVMKQAPVKRRSRRAVPDPGVIPIDDPELG